MIGEEETLGVGRAGHGARMCGDTRVDGAIYAECGLGGTTPLEDFVLDYPVVLPPEAAFPIPARGVKLVQDEATGVWHVLDRVGEDNYPDPTVFLEEVRALGLSRRLPTGMDYSKLTAESRMLMVHEKGWINEWADFAHDGWTCPKHEGGHAPGTAEACCAGVWWENSLWNWKMQPVGLLPYRDLTIQLPCGHTYQARTQPFPGALKLTYSRALIARFPITALSVIAASGNPNQQALLAAGAANGIPLVVDSQ